MIDQVIPDLLCPVLQFIVLVHLFRRVHHRRVIPPPQQFTNLRQGDVVVLPQDVHRKLARDGDLRRAVLAGQVGDLETF